MIWTKRKRGNAAQSISRSDPPAPLKAPSLPKACEEVIQIPGHQLESENFVGGRRLLHDPAYVIGERHVFIKVVRGAKLALRRPQKKLIGTPGPTGVAQTVTQEIASRPGDSAEEITAAGMPPMMKQSRQSLGYVRWNAAVSPLDGGIVRKRFFDMTCEAARFRAREKSCPFPRRPASSRADNHGRRSPCARPLDGFVEWYGLVMHPCLLSTRAPTSGFVVR